MIEARRRSSLFLMELIVSILIFALAASVCLSLFGGSRRMSRQSEALTTATTLASSIAERFQACDSRVMFLSSEPFDDNWVAGYGADGLPALGDDVVYTVEVILGGDDGLVSATIRVTDIDGTALQLTTAKYAPGEVWA